jgi:hypothetical protein
LFLNTSYSAIIVSLLQTPSEAVNTLTELIESPFQLSMEDVSYNTQYVNVRGQTVRTAHGHNFYPLYHIVTESLDTKFLCCSFVYCKRLPKF